MKRTYIIEVEHDSDSSFPLSEREIEDLLAPAGKTVRLRARILRQWKKEQA